jgi:cell division protein FtsL
MILLRILLILARTYCAIAALVAMTVAAARYKNRNLFFKRYDLF